MRRIAKTIITLFIFSMLSSTCLGAGVGKKMQNFFSKGGVLSNHTKGGAYQSQAAGYYTGGSYVARVPIQNTNFVNLQMPSMKSGCGGIDVFMGGLGFVQAKELMALGKSIVSNAGPYAANLAIKTMSPEIASTMEKLESMAQQMNQFSMSSCQSAQQLLHGVWPKSEAASAEICKREAIHSGLIKDRITARHECGTKGKALMRNKTKSEKFFDQLSDEYNLAWQAIQKNTFLAKNNIKAELFMSLSGTIISRISEDQETLKHEILPSLALNNKLVKALLEGGDNVEIYSCGKDTDKCLSPIKKTISIDQKQSVTYFVREVIQSIETKARNGGELEPHELGFIEQTKLPVLTYIKLSILRNSNNSILALDSGDYVELIASDILLNYMSNILDTVSEGLNHIRMVQLSDHDIKDFLDSIFKVKQHIKSEQKSIYAYAEKILKMNEVARLSEKETFNTFYHATKKEKE